MKKKAKNPLLIGACSIDALSNFTVCVQRGKYRVLDNLIDGLSIISVENEILEFLSEGAFNLTCQTFLTSTSVI